MHPVKVWAVTLVLFSTALPASDEPVPVLLGADAAFNRATQERGLEGWLSFFAADAVIFPPDGQLVTGSGPIRDYYAELGFPPPGFRWEPVWGDLAASGDLGFTMGTWEAAAPEGGGGPAPSGVYLSVWRLQPDGSWKVVADSGGFEKIRSLALGLSGPPSTFRVVYEITGESEAGDMSFGAGRWYAERGEERAEGKILTVWERGSDGAWRVDAEIGFPHPPVAKPGG